MSTASDLLAKAAVINPEKRVNWSMQRRVPTQIVHDRKIAEIKLKIKETTAAFINKFKGKPSIFITLKKVKKTKTRIAGYQIIGHGNEDGTPRVVPNLEAAKDFARSIKRSRMKMGEKEWIVG